MRYHLRVLRWVRAGSPLLAFVLGVGLLSFFISQEFWSIVGPIAGFTVGSVIMILWLIYTFISETDKIRSVEFDQLPVQVPIIVTCLYIISMIWIFRFALHQRPLTQYVLFAGFSGFISYQIASGASPRRIVPQILTLSFLTYWSVQWLFPAGMYAIDTYNGYIPRIGGIIARGYYPGTGAYMGHLIHTAEFSLFTGLSVQMSYFILATSLLTGTVLIISTLNRSLPSLTKQAALFAALVFAISSWTLGRGMHPNKLNYFYPLIVLFGIVAIQLYQAIKRPKISSQRWFIVGCLIIPATVFGHRFSAGVTMMFLLAIFAFTVFGRVILAPEYRVTSKGFLGPFVVIYLLAVVGNPLHQGALIGRFVSLTTSVVFPEEAASTAAGPGRFSQLQLDVLLASTTAQSIIFALAVIGSIWMFRERKWDHDLVLFWIVCLGSFLGVALVQNSVDTAPQRFYGVLMLFGFNIAIAIAFDALRTLGSIKHPFSRWGRSLIVICVILLATTSLVSPIAERSTSPVSDEIPDIRQFDTMPLIEGNDWVDRYTMNEKRIVAPTSDIPIDRTGLTEGVANRTAVESGTMLVYSQLSQQRGVQGSGGLAVGGRVYLFVSSPEQPSDRRVYTNGETTVFMIS